ncbi:MAG: efflux RND transporter periplasmic adaptor subunit [Planctomycetota bacterium]
MARIKQFVNVLGLLAVGILLAAVVMAFKKDWRLAAADFVARSLGTNRAAASGDPHAGHQPQQATAEGEERIVLTEQGRWSAGIELGHAERKPYERSVTFPGIVRTRPGRSIVKVPAPLTGIVTRVHRERGEAVVPGQPLFDIVLTHEELIKDQAEFLAALQKAKVLEEEIGRMRSISEGIMPRKELLNREYEFRQLQAELDTFRQVLQLHRLPAEQVANIERNRKLVESLTVYAPEASLDHVCRTAPDLLQIQEIAVEKGQQVTVGEPMCVLADHCELQIEGSAFEDEVKVLHEAVQGDRPVAAVFETEDGGKKQMRSVPGLRVVWVDDRVDQESRTVRFSVRLPNEGLVYDKTEGQRRFIARQFKPGQRCKLQVSVETLKNCLVLPLTAVTEDRVQNCVFVQSGDTFALKVVKVRYRGPTEVVVEDSATGITPHDVLVVKGAGQLLAAIRSGGALQSTCDCGQQH